MREGALRVRSKTIEAGVGGDEEAAVFEIEDVETALKKLLISCKRIIAPFFLEERKVSFFFCVCGCW